MERYTLIKKFDNILCQTKCPIIVLSSALTKDNEKNKLLCQIKFQNITQNVIEAVFVNIKFYDIESNHVETVKYKYLDLFAHDHDIFGDNHPIYLNNQEIRSLNITCEKIIFKDGTVFNNESEASFSDKVECNNISNKITDKHLLDELSHEVSNIGLNASNIKEPYFNKTVRVCSCGSIILSEEETCNKCKMTQEQWDSILNVDNLQEKYDNRIEELNRKRIERNKTIKKIVAISAVILAIIGTTFIISKRNEELIKKEKEALKTADDKFFDLDYIGRKYTLLPDSEGNRIGSISNQHYGSTEYRIQGDRSKIIPWDCTVKYSFTKANQGGKISNNTIYMLNLKFDENLIFNEGNIEYLRSVFKENYDIDFPDEPTEETEDKNVKKRIYRTQTSYKSSKNSSHPINMTVDMIIESDSEVSTTHDTGIEIIFKDEKAE